MNGNTILLVDDDRLVLSSLGLSLQAAGYKVETASNGEEAIRLCEQATPDLAVLDVRMPGMDGVEVARWMNGHKAIPFIFLSAYSDDGAVMKAIAEGAMGYLIKPVDPPQLLATIRAALARSADHRALREKEEQLNQALAGDRAISTAVGFLISHERLNEKEAFDKLREYARSNRRKLADVAQELVKAAEKMNQLS
ncbi:MAG: response regulator [Candidatus Thiodiazotropha sp. (ex Troendleina suluensis)]|nr:response regulator [Candidatus Thiodiazotropha sp. (ex Troendleina suluensis)]